MKNPETYTGVIRILHNTRNNFFWRQSSGRPLEQTLSYNQMDGWRIWVGLNTQSWPTPVRKADTSNQLNRCFIKQSFSLLQASDAYLQMAIGNAPWPIGVTMVGIHARTGREKIFSKNVAHVMNDETQRKYIQALKRLMTKCQEYFPTDPSRCVEYTTTS